MSVQVCVCGGRGEGERINEIPIHNERHPYACHLKLATIRSRCSSVVDKVLSPATVLKLCPPGVAIAIGSGIAVEEGGCCNQIAF